ncbi:helix-turn-helix transcriptional regulator [Kitasatospora sp. NPDC086791]|uniref:helix-turn-helix domain-containing protein n=1 Tax=Kitasatospora sp. NPDC086791 TaxID=3155178 RepID=UPI00343CB4AA
MSTHAPNEARVIPLRPQTSPAGSRGSAGSAGATRSPQRPSGTPGTPGTPAPREPLWRDLVGGALRRERLAQERTLKDVAETARISMPYLSELERGRKEASSEVLAAAAKALGLGLADLLSLAQDELTRYPRSQAGRGRAGRSRAGLGRTSPTAQYDGLCLVA